MNWDDIRIFLTVGEMGSFRKAAKALNLSHATLSRRIESLEKSLNVKIFNRQTTGLSLTDAGETMLASAEPVKKMIDELKIQLYGQDQCVTGKITLTLPEYLSTHLVLPALGKFQDLWPDLIIEVITDNKVLDLLNQDADIAIRVTNSPDETLVGRQVGGLYQAAYASETYLIDFKENYHNSRAHNWIKPLTSSKFNIPLFKTYNNHLPIKSNLILCNIEAQFMAAKFGKGIAILPCLLGDSTDQLIRISPIYNRKSLWLLSHKDLRANKRMQLFRAFLVKLFEDNQDLISGNHDKYES